MPIELGTLTLNRIHKIATTEQAAFVHHPIPGLEGSATQNLGRQPVRLTIEGIFFGVTAKDDLTKLRELYIKREALDFVADIVGEAYIGKVLLEKFEVMESAADPTQFSYLVTVVEYTPSTKTTSAAAATNQKAAALAADRLSAMSLPDDLSLGSIPEISDPITPLKASLEPVREATTALTDSLGALKNLFG